MQGLEKSVIFIKYSLILMQQGCVIFTDTFLTHFCFCCWLNSIYLKPTLLQHPASCSLHLVFYLLAWLEPTLPFVFPHMHTRTHACIPQTLVEEHTQESHQSPAFRHTDRVSLSAVATARLFYVETY